MSATGPAPGPYFLACNVCRWNSKEIDMTFEKPTSLACKYTDITKTGYSTHLCIYSATTEERRSLA